MSIANLARYGALATIPKAVGGAGRFANVMNWLKPAGKWVSSHPKMTGAGLFGTHALLTEGPGAVPGAALRGGLAGWGMGGVGGPGGVKRATGLLGMVPGINPATAALGGQVLAPAAQIAATGALGGLYGPLASGASNVAGTGGAIAAGQLTGSPNVNSGDVLGSGNLPPGTTARMIGPQGGVWYQLDPQGLPAGDRLGRQLGAMTDANVLNTLGNALYGQTERVAKSELARQAAAEQLKANIDMAKRMSLNSQEAGLRVGMDAGKSMADAMSNRNNFRYL